MFDRSEYYNTKEVADRLGIALKTVQDWAKQNKIPGQIRMGHFWQFKKTEIDKALLRDSFLDEALPN